MFRSVVTKAAACVAVPLAALTLAAGCGSGPGAVASPDAPHRPAPPVDPSTPASASASHAAAPEVAPGRDRTTVTISVDVDALLDVNRWNGRENAGVREARREMAGLCRGPAVATRGCANAVGVLADRLGEAREYLDETPMTGDAAEYQRRVVARYTRLRATARAFSRHRPGRAVAPLTRSRRALVAGLLQSDADAARMASALQWQAGWAPPNDPSAPSEANDGPGAPPLTSG